jgi:hypothetical protein
MAEYRVYLLDLDDRITVGKDIECDTAEQAHALAQGFLLEAPGVEIWRGKDFVAKLAQGPGEAP